MTRVKTLPMMPSVSFKRRSFLACAGALAIGLSARQVEAHNAAGLVEPALGVPKLQIQRHDGQKQLIAQLLKGRVTALQLMFTGCSSTCPIQGAQFEQLQSLLPATSKLPIQLVSASIDPLSDEPLAMRGWLKRYNAGQKWLGITPDIHGLDAWLDFLNGRATGLDKHTGQVYVFNARAQLVLRTVDFPKPAELVRELGVLANR